MALDKLLKDHGNPPNSGIQITITLHLPDVCLEYADDAAMPDSNAAISSERLTNFSVKAEEQAGMKISIQKTKAQHI